MTPTDVGTLILAGIAIVGCIGSVLLLAYRVGRLTGTTEARISFAENDRTHLWQKLGGIASKLDRHVERGTH